MTSATTPSKVVAEFVDWLAAFLPNDYYENYRRYRWDIPLRRDYQRAAFEGGWPSRPGPVSTAVDRWAYATR